jgi:ABC-type multidrug transport system fused ATPase/permease subunit
MFSFFLDLKLPLRCIYKKNREARDMYVNVENVNFAYDKKPILHDINFGMNKGEMVL